MTNLGAEGHRITVSEPNVTVRVEVDGVIIADTQQARVLQEGSYVPRYYVPRADVRTDLLVPTDLSSTCPFKGDASYWHLELEGTRHENLVWCYEDPIPAMAEIAGLLCFYNERVEIRVSSERP